MNMPRTFAIPDIHGNCRTFQQLVFKQIKLAKCDTLYLLGDYIDRGPDSKGVIDTIISLQNDGYDIRPIRGNHEQMFIDFLQAPSDDLMEDWLYIGGEETLESYYNAGMDEIPEEHLQFFFSLPLFRETPSEIFVHAGLDFTLPDPLADTDAEFMIWGRDCEAVDAERIGGRRVIAGHTIKSLPEIIKSLQTNYVQLDNGCFLGNEYEDRGCLVALELNNNHLHIQENIDPR